MLPASLMLVTLPPSRQNMQYLLARFNTDNRSLRKKQDSPSLGNGTRGIYASVDISLVTDSPLERIFVSRTPSPLPPLGSPPFLSNDLDTEVRVCLAPERPLERKQTEVRFSGSVYTLDLLP
jgi:hypothetical protein